MIEFGTCWAEGCTTIASCSSGLNCSPCGTISVSPAFSSALPSSWSVAWVPSRSASAEAAVLESEAELEAVLDADQLVGDALQPELVSLLDIALRARLRTFSSSASARI